MDLKKIPYPCKDCTSRVLGCHDTCEKYQQIKKDNISNAAALRNERFKGHSADDLLQAHAMKHNRDKWMRRKRGSSLN